MFCVAVVALSHQWFKGFLSFAAASFRLPMTDFPRGHFKHALGREVAEKEMREKGRANSPLQRSSLSNPNACSIELLIMMAPKIFIVGLDAATWDLINPWIKEGLLPNLAKLVESGVSGQLQSAIPPLTPPAWTSFMTGQNPGKHGIFHFLESRPGTYAMRYSNAGSRRARTLWRMLSDAGHTVGAMNIPFTYPPEQIKGFQISGMDTPNEQSAFIHPPELRAELEELLGKIRLEVRYLGSMSNDERRDQVLAEMEKIDLQWTKAALHLLEKHPAEVMMCTFMSIDTVQHYFWHYMDAAHFLHDPFGAVRYRDAIQRVYRRLDDSVGKFLAQLPEETTVLAVSDHGGGPVSDRVVYLNRYLAQLGLLFYKEEAKGFFARARQKVLRTIHNVVRANLSSGQKKLIASMFPVLRERFEDAATSFANIDWGKTKAFCSEVLAYPPSIVINSEGSQPNGIVKSTDYEALCALITQKLSELRDPRDGSLIIPRIYRREELFTGPFAGEAPDLVLDWWSANAFTACPSFPEEGHLPALKIRPREPMTNPEWSGTHRLQGIVIARSPAMKRGAKIENARLVDMTPTLLYLMGEKIPADLDGRVLTEMFEPAYLESHPIQYEGAGAAESSVPQSSPYSAEEAAQVEERLKALGYID